MANFLELQLPYLDHHLFEFAATLPPHFKIQGKTTKLALREAFKDLLPDNTLNRPKRGFPVPIRLWLKLPSYQKYFKELLAGSGGVWFHRDKIWSLYRGHLSGRIDASRKLWTIMIFLLWHDLFMSK